MVMLAACPWLENTPRSERKRNEPPAVLAQPWPETWSSPTPCQGKQRLPVGRSSVRGLNVIGELRKCRRDPGCAQCEPTTRPEIVGKHKMIVPEWDCCWIYDQELCNEAMLLAVGGGYAIKTVVWPVCNDQEHQLDDWCMLMGMANPGSSSDDKVARHDEQIEE